ncbi:MAG: hypothetical protein II135_04830 [Clostridia bacterium]|nr:hypothetical protein [Clostridia bacterium]
MKKVIALIVCAIMICLSAISVFAVTSEESVKAAELEVFIQPDTSELSGAFQMRGFTASPDGKYVYGGFLQGGRLVGRYDAATKELKGTYKPASDDNELYCKGLAVDDRGYLYVGITHNGQDDVSVAVVNENLEQIGYFTEHLGGGSTGINGVAVQKLDGKYYLYAVTAYNTDTVRCYDVTDPSNISLNAGFGTNGVIDYAALTGADKDPSYIAVDEEGFVYLTYLKSASGFGKGSNVAKIAKDGKSIVKDVEVKQAYGICEAGDYLFVATNDKADSNVHVLKKADLSEVAVFTCAGQSGASFSDVAFGGGYLFVGDHGDNTNSCGLILRTKTQLVVKDEAEQPPADTGDPGQQGEDPGQQGGQQNPPSSDAAVIAVAAVACATLAGAIIVKKAKR